MSQLCNRCIGFSTCKLPATQVWYNVKYQHYSTGSELHRSAESGCHLCQFFEAALLSYNRTPGDTELPDRQIWLQCVQQTFNHMNNSIQISIEPLSLRSAGYRGFDVHEVEQCIWLQSSENPEKELAILEGMSNGPLGQLGPVAGVVVHKEGRKYFYRGRTLSADLFYAVRQPYYRAEVHCTLIPDHISQALDQGLELARQGLVDDHTGSYANLFLMLEWLNNCATRHTNCIRYLNATVSGGLPSRVLDVGGTKDQVIHLHIPKPEEKARYIALSHRWGDTNPLTTTTKTLPDRMAGIALSTLSQTFREAVSVARLFNTQYLWIDSLCILQDSRSDWEEQAALMGTIYQRAFLTIAATDTEDTTSGLFFSRSPTKHKPRRLHLPLRKDMFVGESGALYAVSPNHRVGKDTARPRGPLDNRAWVLQEQILSGRILNFTKEQVYFECLSTDASEGVPHSMDSAVDNSADYVSTLKCGIGGLLSLDEPKIGNHFHRAWYLMVEDYSRRLLTVPTDKWAAMLGIVTELQRATGDICSFGLWRRWMAHDLLWSVYSTSYPDTSLSQKTRFSHGPNGKRNASLSSPSWSWLQIDGHIRYVADAYNDLLQDQVLLDELEMLDAEPTADPGVDHKHLPRLRIRGPLKPGILALRRGYTDETLSGAKTDADAGKIATNQPADSTATSRYDEMAEPDLVPAALDPTDDRATRKWRIASDLEEEIYGPKQVIDEDEPIIGTIPEDRLARVIHETVQEGRPAADRRMTELYAQNPETDEQRSDLLRERLNKYIVATQQKKTPMGFWAPDVDGELVVPRAEDLTELSDDQVYSSTLLFAGICRGGGWVRCLGLQLVGTGVDAMLANVWRRVGLAWILEEAWDNIGGIEANGQVRSMQQIAWSGLGRGRGDSEFKFQRDQSQAFITTLFASNLPPTSHRITSNLTALPKDPSKTYMQPAPSEIFQNATSVELSPANSASTHYGLPEHRQPASDRLPGGGREPQQVLPDNTDALSVSSRGTSRGREPIARRLSSRTGSSYSSSPGSRIEEYERKHAKPRKREDGMIFQVVQSKETASNVRIEEFPNEVLTHILSHLPPETLSSMSLVSRRFHKLVTTPPAWRIAFARYFPGVESLAVGPPPGLDTEKSQRRSFTRLSALASWRSEYILRTRLIRSIGRGRPGLQIVAKSSAPRSSGNAGLAAAVITYQSGLMFPISHMHATFGVGLNKRQPLFIHGAAEQGLVSSSDPATGKVGPWGLADYQAFQHFSDLYAGETEFGLGPGEVVGMPNSLDVSQPYGRVYGEGCPGGRLFYTAYGEQRGRFLPISSNADHIAGIPDVTMIGCSVCSVWIAKSEFVLKVTEGVFGLLAGFSNGVLAAYALGNNAAYDNRYEKGDPTAKWVLCPGVPIIAIAVDEHVSRRKVDSDRIYAVALNALGEIFYLSEAPVRPVPKSKATSTELDHLAWRTGRTVDWVLLEATRRQAKVDPFSTATVDGSYSPRTSSDRTGLDEEQTVAETLEVEKFIQHKPKHFRAQCEGWDMQRKLVVDFAGDGESVMLISRGLDDDPAGIKRYTRCRKKRSVDHDLESWPTIQQTTAHRSVFGGLSQSASPTPQSMPRSRTSSTDDIALKYETEWRISNMSFVDLRALQITAAAIDESDFAQLAPMEDPLLGMSSGSNASSPLASPMGQAHSFSSSADVPGHRARLMAVGTNTGVVLLWDVRASLSPALDVVNTVQPVRAIYTKSPEISSIALTSLYIVHGGNDGLVQAWDPLASTLEPIRTLNSRFSDRARRRIAQAGASAQGVGHNYFAAAAIVLDPDPTVLRGMVSLGTHLRYWSYSSTAADAYKSRKRGQLRRRSDRGGSNAAGEHKVTATGRGMLKDYIANEQSEMEREKMAKRKEHERMSDRFGTMLLGADASEEELLAYATMLSEESMRSDAAKRASQDSSAVASPRPDWEALAARTSSKSGDVDADIEEAIRLSLLESERPASAPHAEEVNERGFDIPIRYAKSGKRSTGTGSPWGKAAGSSSNNVREPTEEDDLKYALELSLAEEASRTQSGADEVAFPPLLSTSSGSERSARGEQGKGKGRRR